MAYTIDDFLKENTGYTKSYDSKTGVASLADALSGKTLSFKSGQTNNAGILGGYTNGSNNVDANALKSYFTGGGNQTTGNYAQTTDNSNLIDQSTNNLVAALKSQIQQSINNKNLEISQLGQKYQKPINESEVRGQNELRTALEQSANMGDRGGNGRMIALQTQTDADNRLKDFELQKGNEEASLRNDIANMLLEGNVQEAQIRAQSLRDLLSEKNRVDDTNYNRSQDAFNNDLKTKEFNQNSEMNRLSIEAKKLENAALPDKIKGEAKLLQQQISTGSINQQEAEYKLKQLTDPNSVTNKLINLDLQMKQLEAKNLPEKERLELQEMKKRIAQIGAAPYRSPEQIEKDKQEVEYIKAQINALNNKTDTNTTYTVDDYSKAIDGMYVTAPNMENGYQRMVDKAGIANYIKNLESNLPDTESSRTLIDNLLMRYGLPTGR